MDVETRKIDDYTGNGLCAKKFFKSGTTIFEEDPLVCCQFSWNAHYKYKACDHCLRPLETAQENAKRLANRPDLILPYPECCTTNKDTITPCDLCEIEYCSQECREIAYERYHRTLCVQTKDEHNDHPLKQLNEAWKQIHYPPETSTVMLIARMLAYVHQSNDREAARAQIMRFCHRTVNEDQDLAHKLMGANFSQQIALLHQLLTAAVPHDGVEQLLTLEAFYSMLGLIGTNGQGVGTSAISQWYEKAMNLDKTEEEQQKLLQFIDEMYELIDEHSGMFLNNEGVALYSLQSNCNHSCCENAEVRFLHNSSRLSLVATKDIEVGEEICINYLDHCARFKSREKRQSFLKENYLFVCRCQRCLSDCDFEEATSSDEDDDNEMSE